MRGAEQGGGWAARAAGVFARVEEYLIAYLLAAMMINTFAQVVARRLFNSGAVWANELTQLLFAYLVMLGMSYGIRQGGHMGVDFVVRLFGPPVRRSLNLVAAALCFIYAGTLGAAAAAMAWSYRANLAFLTTEDLDVPVWFNYGVVAAGFLLIAVRLVGVTREIRAGVRDGVPVVKTGEGMAGPKGAGS